MQLGLFKHGAGDVVVLVAVVVDEFYHGMFGFFVCYL